MNYQQIIDHYYVPGKLRDILMVHSRKVADKAMGKFLDKLAEGAG